MGNVVKKLARETYDDDNLHDDIEDKNASFSEYSVTKAQSTQNTSSSGNSSGSGSSQKKRKKKKPSMFSDMFSRFTRMLNRNKGDISNLKKGPGALGSLGNDL